MKTDEIRKAVLEAIASIAPDADVRAIRPGEPLRQQVDLDSMDWLNFVSALHERLAVDIPESDYARLATLDSLVAYLGERRAKKAARPRRAAMQASAPPPTATHLIRGAPVTVRPIRPDDAPMEADFVRHLSEDARYMRFMASMLELPEAKLKYLTEVDQVRHVALVATVEREGKTVEVGVARYIVDPKGTGCEFAIAIDDEWQGSGIAGVLMHALMGVARRRGLATMEGIVLASNVRMLRFTRQLGFRAERDPGDPGTLRVVMALR